MKSTALAVLVIALLPGVAGADAKSSFTGKCSAAEAQFAKANDRFADLHVAAKSSQDPGFAKQVSDLQSLQQETAALLQECKAAAATPGTNAKSAGERLNAATIRFSSNVSALGAGLSSDPAFVSLGQKIVSKIGIACLSSPISDSQNPNCIVEDRSNVDASVVDTIESCASSAGVQPCWRYMEDAKCPAVVNPVNGFITQGSISILRDQEAIPPGTHVRVACATIAHSDGLPEPRPKP